VSWLVSTQQSSACYFSSASLIQFFLAEEEQRPPSFLCAPEGDGQQQGIPALVRSVGLVVRPCRRVSGGSKGEKGIQATVT